MSMRFSLVICLSALAFAVALPGVAYAADESNTDQAPVTLSDEQIAALEDASAQDSGDKSVFEEVGDFVTDNLAYFILGIVILAAIIAGILIMRGRSHQGGPDARSSATGQPSAAEMKRRKRAAIQRSREEERLRRKGGLEGRGSTGQAAAAAAAGAAAGTAASVDPVEAEKIGARDQQRAAAAVARTGGAIPAPASPSQTAPSAAVTAGPAAEQGPSEQGPAAPEPFAQGPEPDTIVTAAPSEPQPVTPGPEPQAGQTAAALAAGAAGGALAGRATAPAAPAADPPPDQAAQDAEERLRAKVEEIKAEQAREPGVPPAESDLRKAEQLERELEASTRPPGPTPGLAAVERRLSADSEARDRTLREAEDRLRRIEQRAEDAERRAAFAERLAQLKVEESDRERRLNEVVSGIDRAEQRAREAEARAAAAERAAAEALEERDAPRADLPDSGSPSGVSGDRGAGIVSGGGARDPEVSGPGETSRPSAAKPGSGTIDLNSATFEDLRNADLSVTQATRILAYRERFGGYRSVDDLEKVPGFPDDLIESLRDRVTV